MTSKLSEGSFQLLKKYIEDITGIEIAQGKAYLIETRLEKILEEFGVKNFEELSYYLIKKGDKVITEKIVDAITTNETFWFRDKSPWEVLENTVLPQCVKLLRENKKSKIRIWSAAASTGQEAYSTAMCIDTYLKKNLITDIKNLNFEIVATDISGKVLEEAKNGIYDYVNMTRGLDEDYEKRYFTRNGNNWAIKTEMKEMVRFDRFNLKDDFYPLGKFDIVFCRYVLIYFSDRLKDRIIEKIYEMINPEGILFVGSSELYNNIYEYFVPENYNTYKYYRNTGKVLIKS